MDGNFDPNVHNPEIDDRPDEAARGKGLSKIAKGFITAAIVIAYILVPVDVVPDVLVGIGQVDDAIVLAAGIISAIAWMRGDKRQ